MCRRACKHDPTLDAQVRHLGADFVPKVAPLERDVHPVDPPPVDADHLERDIDVVQLGMAREPCLGSQSEAPLLLPADHVHGLAEIDARAHLHLTEHEMRPSPQHEIELVPARACVRVEDAVAAKAVVEARATLGRATGRYVACSSRARASSSVR